MQAPAKSVRRKVFVAYSYKLYPDGSYRDCFIRVGHKHGVEFVFADTRITSQPILEKIHEMIREASLSLFDISDWNSNVTLELGFAQGIGHPWFILIDPSKSTGKIPEAQADLRGFGRIEYDSSQSLEAGLSRLIEQLLGRSGLLSTSIGEAIRDHVFSQLDLLIKERTFAPDRDRTVAILPSGRVLPLETEVLISELPQNEIRFPPDPFHPSAPVGPWISRPAGRLVGIFIGACFLVEIGAILSIRSATLPAISALLVTTFVGAWYFSEFRKRRAFERATPHSVTYRRPRTRSVGPYFVWEFADPADPDDPRHAAIEGDPRAVGVELKRR